MRRPGPCSLIREYLRATVDRNDRNDIVFSQWLLLRDMALARSVAEAVATEAGRHPAPDACCVLADSGIPLGVLIAQALGQPMHFYRRQPWTIDNDPVAYSVYPRIPSGSTVSLVDSHTMTGFTSSACHDVLAKSDVQVDRVITAISLFDLPTRLVRYKRSVDYLRLCDATAVKDILVELFDPESWNDVGGAIREAAQRARQDTFTLDSMDEMGSLPPKSRGFLAIAGFLLRGHEGQVHYVSRELVRELRELFDPTESDTWRFFTRPDLIRRVSEVTGQAVDLSRFDVIIATDYLGLIFALCLAWHNEFNGMILSTRTPLGWKDVGTCAGSKRCLICSGMIFSSNYVLGAIRLSSAYGLKPETILCLRFAGEKVGFPRSRAVLRLDGLAVDVFAVS